MTGPAILGLAFVAGLLAWGLPGGGLWLLGLGLVMAGVRSSAIARRLPWLDPSLKPLFWVVAGCVGLMATLYLQWRLPQPGTDDISRAIARLEQTGQAIELATVRGQVDSDYQITQSGKARFWLQSTQLLQLPTAIGPATNPPPQNLAQSVTGRVYATVPLLQATGLKPGQMVEVTGRLYRPQRPTNPGGFDFAWYLQREGSFAGVAGQTVQTIDGAVQPDSWWSLSAFNPQMVRKRLVQSLVKVMGFPEGAFLGALILGRQAVDLPADLQTNFVRAGLSHVLTASGFQIVVILGVFLGLIRARPLPLVVAIGGGILLGIYVWLAGASPSVLRAGLMGIAVLWGMTQQRQVNSLGALLAAVVVMLCWNPLWIWDLGFQFSVLATLGLVVSATTIAQRLSWLPEFASEPIASALAATIWTIPVQLWAFYQISVYGPIASALTSLWVSVLTVAGLIAAVAIGLLPPLGNWVASGLVYPVRGLLTFGEWIAGWPGSAIAVGAISIRQLLVLYLLLVAVWQLPWFQRANRWSLVAIGALVVAIGPGWLARSGELTATVLDAGSQPMLAVRDGGRLLLAGAGDLPMAQFTVLPFLRQQGINRIEVGVVMSDRPDRRRGWLQILEQQPIANLYDQPLQTAASNVDRAMVSAARVRNGRYSNLTAGQTFRMGRANLTVIDPIAPALTLELGKERWFLLGNCSVAQQKLIAQTGQLRSVTGLWWPGQDLAPELVAALQPRWAIASTRELAPTVTPLLRSQRAQLYQTGEDGAITWTAHQGWRAALDSTPSDQPL